MKKAIFILGFCALLIGCQAQALENALRVSQDWVRLMPDGFDVTAAYMVLENGGENDIIVNRAESRWFERIEIHDHIADNGVMRMRPIAELVIPAQGATTLKPGGKHLMLYGFKEKLTLGEKIEIILFQGSEQVLVVTPEVRRQSY